MKLNPNSCAFFPDRNSIGRKPTLNPNADPYECNPFSRDKKSPFKHVRSKIKLGARSFVHMKTCRSPKEDFFVQSGGYINNTRNYMSLPTSKYFFFMVYHQIILIFPQVMPLGSPPIFLYQSKILVLHHQLYFILTLQQSALYLLLMILLKVLLQGKLVPP